MIKESISVCLFFLIGTHLLGQSSAPIAEFKSGDKIFSENAADFIANPDVVSDEVIDGYYYRYVQFYEIPRLEQQQDLVNMGLVLVEYVPNNTYLVAFPDDFVLSSLPVDDVRSIVPVDIEDKLDQRFLDRSWPAWAEGSNGLKVVLKAHPLTSENSFVRMLRREGVTVDKNNVHFPWIFTEIQEGEILNVADLPFVHFMDLGPDPGEPEDFGGRNLQRANILNSLVPNGLRFDASEVNVLVRDDGVVGPHIDFQGRMFDFTGGANTGTHGDGVAGVFAGAGNLDPTVQGGASGANVYVTNYESSFTDITIDLHQNHDVMITNSSYSNGCNAGYTSTTQRVDQQMIDNPSLMHVFSGGNSNNNNCGYGAGNQWGNVTGGHKQGKNVIAVANLFADGTLVNSSSRGPAHDGRIKPDISAHGQNQRSTNPNNQYQTFGGTSAAAPTFAGSFAQLYQVYRIQNGGANPNAGMMKAVVLNSAYDKGNVGPDYRFGWGRLDAFKAYKTLTNNYYLSGSIAQAGTNNHMINVPAGVSEARFMIYWTDPAGAVNTARALVNDLDIFVTDPGSTRHDPWVLDPTPNAATLNNPATRGVDNLNNMEQVSIISPAAGTYNLQVNGTAIPAGVQNYYIVWSFWNDGLMITYPAGGEGLVPGQTERIHWNATGTTGTFSVDYSTNNGLSWTNISSTVPGTSRLLSWTVPNTVTSEALVRVSRNGQFGFPVTNFSIIGLPTNLNISAQCLTGATLSWNAVNGADSYEVFKLGEKFMESVGTTTSLNYEFSDLPVGETVWFSVRALNNQGAKGRRAIAISHFTNPANTNCRNTIAFTKTVDLTEANAGDTLMYTLTLTSFYDNPISNIQITDILSPKWKLIPGSLNCGGTVNNGVVTINSATLDPDQTLTCNFKVRSDILSASETIVSDNIEGGTGNWWINNITGPAVWQLDNTVSNSPTTSWFSPNTGTANNTQALVLLAQNLGSNPQLLFSHSYDTESGWDGGMVEISIDNGATWTDLGPHMIQNGYNGGLGNGSNPDIASRSAYTGNSGGFINTIVGLGAYAYRTVLIRFVFGEDDNTGSVGWYIDDVVLRNSVWQTNQACVAFDQGASKCSSVSTFMNPCQTNCDSCTDGVKNGNESGVDCGGSLCGPCPCTQGNATLTYNNATIPDGTNEKISNTIETTGSVATPINGTINLQAGTQFLIRGEFATGNQTNMTVLMEACQN